MPWWVLILACTPWYQRVCTEPLEDLCPGDERCDRDAALAGTFDDRPVDRACALCPCGDLEKLSCSTMYYGWSALYDDGQAVGLLSWTDSNAYCRNARTQLHGEWPDCEVDEAACVGPAPTVDTLYLDCDPDYVGGLLEATRAAERGLMLLGGADGAVEDHDLGPIAADYHPWVLAKDSQYVSGLRTALTCDTYAELSAVVRLYDAEGFSDCAWTGPDGAALVEALAAGDPPGGLVLEDADTVAWESCRQL